MSLNLIPHGRQPVCFILVTSQPTIPAVFLILAMLVKRSFLQPRKFLLILPLKHTCFFVPDHEDWPPAASMAGCLYLSHGTSCSGWSLSSGGHVIQLSGFSSPLVYHLLPACTWPRDPFIAPVSPLAFQGGKTREDSTVLRTEYTGAL